MAIVLRRIFFHHQVRARKGLTKEAFWGILNGKSWGVDLLDSPAKRCTDKEGYCSASAETMQDLKQCKLRRQAAVLYANLYGFRHLWSCSLHTIFFRYYAFVLRLVSCFMEFPVLIHKFMVYMCS